MRAEALGGLVLALAAGSALAGSCTGPFAVGVAQPGFNDPARAGRAVGTRVHYPAMVAGTGAAAINGCGFPVVAFGHGFTIANNAYAYLADGLASAGYIVVLPATESGFSPSHLEFGRDLVFVLGAVSAAPQWAAAAGSGRAIGGHSMGGGAAVLGVSAASVAPVLFALAPAETNPSAATAAGTITVPALLITGSRDCVTPTAQHAGLIHAALQTPGPQKLLIDISGASHCQFTTGSFTCNVGEQSCGGSATIAVADQHAQTLALLLPWLSQVLASASFADGFESSAP